LVEMPFSGEDEGLDVGAWGGERLNLFYLLC